MSGLSNNAPEILEDSLTFYLKICYEEDFVYEDNTAANAFMKLIRLRHIFYAAITLLGFDMGVEVSTARLYIKLLLLSYITSKIKKSATGILFPMRIKNIYWSGLVCEIKRRREI